MIWWIFLKRLSRTSEIKMYSSKSASHDIFPLQKSAGYRLQTNLSNLDIGVLKKDQNINRSALYVKTFCARSV